MPKSLAEIEKLINKIFLDYLSAEIGCVGEFSTSIEFDSAQVTSKVREEKAQLLQAINSLIAAHEKEVLEKLSEHSIRVGALTIGDTDKFVVPIERIEEFLASLEGK